MRDLEMILRETAAEIRALRWSEEVMDHSVDTYRMINGVYGYYFENDKLDEIDGMALINYARSLRMGMENIEAFVDKIEERSLEESVRFTRDLTKFLGSQADFLANTVAPLVEQMHAA